MVKGRETKNMTGKFSFSSEIYHQNVVFVYCFSLVSHFSEFLVILFNSSYAETMPDSVLHKSTYSKIVHNKNAVACVKVLIYQT